MKKVAFLAEVYSTPVALYPQALPHGPSWLTVLLFNGTDSSKRVTKLVKKSGF